MRRRRPSVPRAGQAVVLTALMLALGACSEDEPAGTPVASPPMTTETTTSASSSPVLPPTTPVWRPPFVDHVEWVVLDQGRSLQIYPTTAGRRTDGVRDADVAWREVLAAAPDADTPGMRAQFDCHWQFARLVDPEKPSWNIEPWRPVVTEEDMIATRCNPGGPEE